MKNRKHILICIITMIITILGMIGTNILCNKIFIKDNIHYIIK